MAAKAGIGAGLSLLNHLKCMSAYNHWAYGRVFEHVHLLGPQAAVKPCGLFFDSINGTLLHCLLAEALWYMRMQGLSSLPLLGKQETTYAEVSSLWGAEASKWTALAPCSAELEKALVAQCHRWDALLGRLEPRHLTQQFVYRDTKGSELQRERGPILAHVFNHATHQRGQVTTALRQLGHATPELDLLYFLPEYSRSTTPGQGEEGVRL